MFRYYLPLIIYVAILYVLVYLAHFIQRKAEKKDKERENLGD